MQCLLFIAGLTVVALSTLGYYVLFILYADVMPFWYFVGCLVVFACTTTAGISISYDAITCNAQKTALD